MRPQSPTRARAAAITKKTNEYYLSPCCSLTVTYRRSDILLTTYLEKESYKSELAWPEKADDTIWKVSVLKL